MRTPNAEERSWREALDLSEIALRRRIAELDSQPGISKSWGAGTASSGEQHQAALIAHFVGVMNSWTDARMETEVRLRAMLEAARADALAANSRLLTEIGRFAPALVAGPVDIASQLWVTTGQSAWNGSAPSERSFVVPCQQGRDTTQPHGFGLWTSTASVGGASMWRVYLEPWRHVGGIPVPWYTWALRVKVGVKVIEINSATQWADLVCAYPRACAGSIYPDWVAIADEFDGVHMTLPAIVAAQGFYLKTRRGLVAPTFWDVESTVWLKWQFSGAKLLEELRTVRARHICAEPRYD